MKTFKRIALSVALLATLSTITPSCTDDDDLGFNDKPAAIFFGLSATNQLMRYNTTASNMLEATVNITGVPSGVSIISIDFRPATGQLYGLGSNSQLYIINVVSGAATAVGTPFTPAISGLTATIDFNPTVDRIRLVSSSGQNLRLNPETGATAAQDGNINGGSNPSIVSVAYNNNYSGAATTTLFDIDITTRKLYRQDPPNNGTLVEVGTINVDFSGKAGLDINADNTVALATFSVGGATKLYSINLSSASTNFVSDISANLIDIAIPTAPVAYGINATDGSLQIVNAVSGLSPITKSVTGVVPGETILGIDFRPLNGQLYGIGVSALGTARLYTFNLGTGAATIVGTGFTVGTGTSAVGFDFNPTVDKIRFVSGTQNLRLDPVTGGITATDGNLNPGTPAINGAAYTNSFAGATTTTLYVIDGGKLYRQDPPNAGTLVEIGSLGITADVQNGFDIGGVSNNAYALFTIGSVSKIYTINLTTGAANVNADFPNRVTAMAVGLGL